MDIILNMYYENDAFHEYVDEYCKERHYSVEEALSHAIVKEVAFFYYHQGVDKHECKSEVSV